MALVNQIIRDIVLKELNEFAANQGRISKNIVIADKEKANRIKNLHAGTWIEAMINLIQDSGDKGLSRFEIADAVDQSHLMVNPKIKSLIQIGVFTDGQYSKPVKQKSTAMAFRGRPISDKTRVALEVDKKLLDDNEYQPNEEELNVLGHDFIEKLRARVKGELKRGRPVGSKSVSKMPSQNDLEPEKNISDEED